MVKGVNERKRPSDRRSRDSMGDEDTRTRSHTAALENLGFLVQNMEGGNEVLGNSQSLGEREILGKEIGDGGSVPYAANDLNRWYSFENLERELRRSMCELFKANEDALSGISQSQKPNKEAQEVTSLIKPKAEVKYTSEKAQTGIGLGKDKKTTGKNKWKKNGKGSGKGPRDEMITQDENVGMKRAESIDTLEAAKGRAHKRACEAQSPNNVGKFEATAVAARLHRRE